MYINIDMVHVVHNVPINFIHEKTSIYSIADNFCGILIFVVDLAVDYESSHPAHIACMYIADGC